MFSVISQKHSFILFQRSKYRSRNGSSAKQNHSSWVPSKQILFFFWVFDYLTSNSHFWTSNEVFMRKRRTVNHWKIWFHSSFKLAFFLHWNVRYWNLSSIQNLQFDWLNNSGQYAPGTCVDISSFIGFTCRDNHWKDEISILNRPFVHVSILFVAPLIFYLNFKMKHIFCFQFKHWFVIHEVSHFHQNLPNVHDPTDSYLHLFI